MLDYAEPDKTTLRAAAIQLFPLVATETYKKLNRVIEWTYGVDDFWVSHTVKGWDGTKCPVYGFVGRYAEISAAAQAAFVAETNAKKRANPGCNPDIDDPSTPLGSLVADLMNQTISPAQSA